MDEEQGGVRQRLEHERAETLNAYELATLKWVRRPDSKELRAERTALREKLRKGYWELDPYVRARSLYDRTGMIQRGGRIQFYPGEEVSSTVTTKSMGELGVKLQQQVQQQKAVNGMTSKPVVNGHVATQVGGEHRDDDDVD